MIRLLTDDGPVASADRRQGLLPVAALQLAKSAEVHRRKVDGANRLHRLIEGVEFRTGEPLHDAEDNAAA